MDGLRQSAAYSLPQGGNYTPTLTKGLTTEKCEQLYDSVMVRVRVSGRLQKEAKSSWLESQLSAGRSFTKPPWEIQASQVVYGKRVA